MKTRFVLTLAAVGVASIGGVLVACGSGDDSVVLDGGTEDGGGDSTVDSGADAGADTSVTMVDSSTGSDAGHCTPVTGACDLVAQDCPNKGGQKQECVVTTGNTGQLTTVCAVPQASQQLPSGRSCCPDDNNNPCLTGLECIGDPCTDGGPKTGRCSPHCCLGDNSACGVSDPEGIAGSCEVTVTINNNPEYYVCTYKEFCKPLGVQPCVSPNTTCDVQDKFGTSQCDPLFGGAGQGEHQPCGNGCANGLGCFLKSYADGGPATFPDGGSEDECLYFCHTPNSATPFDGGLLTNAYGHGGCSFPDGGGIGETCNGGLNPTDFPAWLSLCLP